MITFSGFSFTTNGSASAIKQAGGRARFPTPTSGDLASRAAWSCHRRSSFSTNLRLACRTPNAVTARLNDAINKALAKPRLRDAFAKMAAEPAGGTPDEFGQFLRSQLAHWGKVVKEANIKMHQ